MNSNQLKPGVVLSYITMGVKILISLTFTPVMLRLLGQSEFGLYNLVASVVSNLSLLSLGLGSAYMRYYSIYKVKDDNKNISKLNGMYLIVFSIIGVVALVVGSILVINIDGILGSKITPSEISTAKILMLIMTFNIALSFPASVFNSYITANEKYVFQKVLILIQTILSPFFMLPLLLMGYGSVGIVIVTTVLNIIVEFCNAVFCFKRIKIQFCSKDFNFPLMKEIIVFSSYIFLNIIVDQINWNLDKFIIGRFWGTISVAIYGVASQLNTYYMSLSTTISNVFIPRVNKLVVAGCSDNEITKLFSRIGRIQFIVLSLTCSGFIFLGRPFINIWAGANYDESYMIALILIVPVTVPLIQNIGIEVQKAKNMHKFRSALYLIIAVVDLAISIPLTKLYGGVGAAIGTSIGQIVGNTVIMNIYYHKKIGINIKYFWSQIFKFVPSLILPTVIGVIIMKFVDLYNASSLIIFGVIYIIVFCVSIWFLGLNENEKSLIISPLQRIKLHFKSK